MPVIGCLSLYTYYVAFELWIRLRSVIPKDLKAFPRERDGVLSRVVEGLTESFVTVLQNITIPRKPNAVLNRSELQMPPT